MEQIKKIIGINLAVLLVYTLLIQLFVQLEPSGPYAGIAILVATMCALTAHIGINLLLSIFYFFKKNSSMGKAFLLSSLMTLLVGFSACLGSASLV